MRAQLLMAHGGVENFRLGEVATLEVAPGMVLVRTAAAATNPVDVKTRLGLPIAPELPAVLGCDVAE